MQDSANVFPSPANSPSVAAEELTPDTSGNELARALEALANPVRVDLLHRLGRPAFMPDLAKEFGITRQALKKHLDALEAVGLVVSRTSRRGALPATEFAANPTGLFALKENVLAIAVTVDPSTLPPQATRPTEGPTGRAPTNAAGLLLVHGDQRGRWFPLGPKLSWILGRDARADISLPYDPFASARHAMLRRGQNGWTITDLHATNGTHVNFRPIPEGETVDVRPGDLLTIGKSHLLLREGM